ncbi:MAG: AAA family ATPase [Planctomycetota bacterium]|jgi:pilus assembly protein CpaE
MRTLIAGGTEDVSRDVREALLRQGVDCRDEDVVPLDQALDRASRTMPELLVVVLPADPAAGLERLREACSILQNAHVLAIGPAMDPQLILRALRQGADEYIDQSRLAGDLSAALGRLKARRAAQSTKRTPGRIVSVMAASGGSGSSMLAASISTVLASQHQECGLVDLRLAAGDLTSMLDLKPSHTLADLCERVTRLDHSMFEQFFARHSSGVWLLAAPTRLAGVSRVTLKGVRQMLAMSRVRFPYVVVDVDNDFGEEQQEALWQADVIVLVLRLDYTSVRNTRRVLDNFVESGIGVENVQLVANGYGRRRQLRLRQAEEALGMKVTRRIPSDPGRANTAINRGIPVALYYPSARITRSIRALTADVNGEYRP